MSRHSIETDPTIAVVGETRDGVPRSRRKRLYLTLADVRDREFWTTYSTQEENGCWLWLRTLNAYGYGIVQVDGRGMQAHRLAYEAHNGLIPDGLQIDHLCRTPACVNPAHLEAVTQRENIRRGTSTAARNAVKTHCKRGHEFDEANTYVDRKGRRSCRACAALWMREANARKAAA